MNYETYFYDIAVSNKSIAHTFDKPKFVRQLTEDESISEHSKSLNFTTPVMVLYLPDASVSDKLSNNVHLHQKVVMHIVQKTKQSNDFKAISQIQYDCLLILFQILGKIQKDHEELIIHGFRREQVVFEKVYNYPSPDVFGQKAEFELHQSINPLIAYKPSNWS